MCVISCLGAYAGFDMDAPTSDSKGKTKVARQLKASSDNLVFIGDGATDMEACPPAVCCNTFLLKFFMYSRRQFVYWQIN